MKEGFHSESLRRAVETVNRERKAKAAQSSGPPVVPLGIVTTKRAALGTFRRMQEKLRNGCGRCSFDEAEGGIVEHCNDCQRTIVMFAWTLFA